LAKRYMSKTGEHIPFIKGKSLTGTARYVSVNTHLGYEQSRRDDLETLGYVLLYFISGGQLPWQNLKAKTKQVKYTRIAIVKQETSIEVLCKNLPEEFCEYMKYCRLLEFEEKPDYKYLRSLFRGIFRKHHFVNDGHFDWTEKFLSKQKRSEEKVELPIRGQTNAKQEPKAQRQKIEREPTNEVNKNIQQPTTDVGTSGIQVKAPKRTGTGTGGVQPRKVLSPPGDGHESPKIGNGETRKMIVVRSKPIPVPKVEIYQTQNTKYVKIGNHRVEVPQEEYYHEKVEKNRVESKGRKMTVEQKHVGDRSYSSNSASSDENLQHEHGFLT